MEKNTFLTPSPRQVAMGTTMSSMGLANKPPALPPVKQNNNTVSDCFFFCFFLSQILFILPTKLNISAFLLQFLFLLMNYGLKVPRLTQQVCQMFLRNQLSIYPERITNIIIIIKIFANIHGVCFANIWNKTNTIYLTLPGIIEINTYLPCRRHNTC